METAFQPGNVSKIGSSQRNGYQHYVAAEERSKVFQEIIKGDILAAIDAVNELLRRRDEFRDVSGVGHYEETQTLRGSKEIVICMFHLKLQWLIELIREDNVLEAISYARNHVYPVYLTICDSENTGTEVKPEASGQGRERARERDLQLTRKAGSEVSANLLSELEDVMALLVFSHSQRQQGMCTETEALLNKTVGADSSVEVADPMVAAKNMLANDHRIQLAFEVNAMLLKQLSHYMAHPKDKEGMNLCMKQGADKRVVEEAVYARNHTPTPRLMKLFQLTAEKCSETSEMQRDD